MRTFAPRMLAVLATALLLPWGLPGCGKKSERELLNSAKGHLEKGEQQTAFIELKSLLQTSPQSAEARALLGEALLKNGNASQAVIELEKARELKHRDMLVLPLLARAMLAAGQPKKVVERFEQTTLDDAAAAADLKTSVAIAQGALGDPERSMRGLDAALKLDSKNSIARLEKARLTGLRFQIDDALTQLDRLLADEPKNMPAMQLKGDLLLGGKGNIAGATKSFRDALAVDERFVPAHLALVTLAQRQNDNAGFRAQVAALKKAVPNSPQARFYEAEISLADGDLKAAREAVQELLRTAPTNPQLLTLAGSVELRNGSFAVAESHLSKALQGAPESKSARYLLAQTYLRMNQGAKALGVLGPLLEEPSIDVQTATLAAQAQQQSGNKAAADALFAQGLKVDPRNPMLLSAMALSQIAKGDVDAGFAQLQSAASSDPGLASDMALINARLRRNDLANALQAVERLQTKVPNKPLPHYLRGRILLQKGDTAAAKQNFEKAVQLDPGYFAAVASLASIDLAEGKPEEAAKRFEALLQRDARDYRAVIAVADFRQSAGAKPQEVTQLLVDAVKRTPTEPALRLRLIAQHADAGDRKAALAAAQDALAAMPDEPAVLDALGELQLTSGSAQQALASFTRAAAAQPMATYPLLRLSSAQERSGDPAAASRTLRRALELAPQLLQAQRGLVQLAISDRRFDDAVAIARQVQKQRPTESVGYVLESETQAAQKRWDAAIAAGRAAYERAKTADAAARLVVLYRLSGQPKDADRFVADYENRKPDDPTFQFQLGTLALGASDFAESESRFRKVLVLRPNDVVALNNIAWLMVQQRKPDAVTFARRANAIQPDSPAVMDTLALTLAAESRWSEAIEWQRKAIAKAPDAPYYRLKLARLLASSGDKPGARDELDKLAKLGKRFPDQAQVAALQKTL